MLAAARLLIMDPLGAYLGNTGSHNNAEGVGVYAHGQLARETASLSFVFPHNKPSRKRQYIAPQGKAVEQDVVVCRVTRRLASEGNGAKRLDERQTKSLPENPQG